MSVAVLFNIQSIKYTVHVCGSVPRNGKVTGPIGSQIFLALFLMSRVGSEIKKMKR